MPTETQFSKLHIFEENDSSSTFGDFKNLVAGTGENSNMQIIDKKLSDLDSGKVNKSGDTINGLLTMNGSLIMEPVGPDVLDGYSNFISFKSGEVSGASLAFRTTDIGSYFQIRNTLNSPVRINGIATPVDDNDAVNKAYVDSKSGDGFLPLTGGEITGDISIQKDGTLSVADSHSLHFYTGQGATRITASVMDGTPSGRGNYLTISNEATESKETILTSIADPQEESDAANKRYVDSVFASGGGGGGDFLPLAGGTLTGNLIRSDSTYGNLTFGKITGMASADGIGISSSASSSNRGLVLRGSVITVQSGSDGSSATINNVATPTANSHAANKQYVDSKTNGFLPIAGGTMTGTLTTRNVSISANGNNSYYLYLNNGGGTSARTSIYSNLDGVVIFKKGTSDAVIRGVATPTSNSDATNKSYVDGHLPLNGSVTVATSAWAAWGDLFRAQITISGVTAKHQVDFYMDYASELALPAPIKPMNDSGTVYAVTSTKPTASITLQYTATLLK